jgi:2-succinyl-6-hydroxy-2,4-cyclohexadiene-1-carboxylate synthase
MKIWALHGFLGRTSDFSELQRKCHDLISAIDWRSVDYMHLRELSPQLTLEEWGEHFCQFVEKASPKGDNVLLGYSQGGRLALQALKVNTSIWRSVILMSTNPGLPATERTARLKSDEEWAEKFLHQNFEKTLEKWNAQSVFAGSVSEPERREEDYNRRQLADCLTRWSVAQQEDFRAFLKQLSVPTLYLTGERDSKYVQIGNALASANPQLTHATIPNAGHRVYLDQPDAVALQIKTFLNS